MSQCGCAGASRRVASVLRASLAGVFVYSWLQRISSLGLYAKVSISSIAGTRYTVAGETCR